MPVIEYGVMEHPAQAMMDRPLPPPGSDVEEILSVVPKMYDELLLDVTLELAVHLMKWGDTMESDDLKLAIRQQVQGAGGIDDAVLARIGGVSREFINSLPGTYPKALSMVGAKRFVAKRKEEAGGVLSVTERDDAELAKLLEE